VTVFTTTAPQNGTGVGRSSFSLGSVARRETSRKERRTQVKRNNSSQLPLHDYRNALKSAVSWLGERYLLAEPVQKRPDEAKPFFAETPRWLPSGR
jgi:hypothetical protein